MSKAFVSSTDFRGESGGGMTASPSSSCVHPTDLPKRKRGRPRKDLPADVLLAMAPRSADVTASGSNDFFAHNGFEGAFDEGLSIPKKFERKSISSGVTGAIQRVDQGSVAGHSVLPPVSLIPQKKAARRRQIDPATCERDYSQDEVEFMNALNAYKRNSGRMFPTCSEILEILRTLGYEKRMA